MPTTITGTQPMRRALYLFTPKVSFDHRDDFGNILSAYVIGKQYTVREGNAPLAALVAKWVKEDKVRIGA